MEKTKVFFIDRDGVINKEIGYLHEIAKFEFIDGVIEALKYIQNKGFEIIVITNQSGIGRGMYSREKFLELNKWMIDFLSSQGVKILDVLYCPHTPEDGCACRKPLPGMFLEAIKKYDIDIEMSWSIGDKETDIQAAKSSGVSNTILVKSGHIINEKNSNASYILKSIYDVMNLDI